MRSVFPPALALMLAMATSAPVSGGTKACTGAMARSCLNALFACFKPKGDCQAQFEILPGPALESRQCWTNGSRIVISAAGTSGTIVYRARKAVCAKAKATITDEQTVAVFRRKRRIWTVTHNGDDSLSVRCPNGRTEQYTPGEVDEQPPSCGSYGAAVCTQGTCR